MPKNVQISYKFHRKYPYPYKFFSIVKPSTPIFIFHKLFGEFHLKNEIFHFSTQYYIR